MVRILAGLAAMALVGSSVAGATCSGDCGGDGTVTVNELVLGVNMLLSGAAATQCPSLDDNSDGSVTVNELVGAVSHLLIGCPFTGLYTARIDVGDGETGLIQFRVGPDGSATGSLGIGATVKAKLVLEVPAPVSLSGTVDLETGAYHFTGSIDGPDGIVPVDVSGTLPDRPGVSGTLELDIGAETFSGPVTAGDGQPTATPTQPLSTPTPTPTAMPMDFPTPGASCLQGAISAVASHLNGTNSNVDLTVPFGLGKLQVRSNIPGIFGGSAVPCSVAFGDVIRKLDIGVFADDGVITTGKAYPLGMGNTGLVQSFVSYLEIPSTNPLGARGWKAHGGAVIIDAIDGDTARFRIVGAAMVAEPSFSAQQPATGTFTLDASAVATHIHDQ